MPKKSSTCQDKGADFMQYIVYHHLITLPLNNRTEIKCSYTD